MIAGRDRGRQEGRDQSWVMLWDPEQSQNPCRFSEE